MKLPSMPKISKKLLMVALPVVTFMLGATAALYAVQTSYSQKAPYSDSQQKTVVAGEFSSAGYYSEFDVNKMYELVNRERIKAGLNPLTRNAKLDASAKAKCDDMVTRDYWGHEDPNGRMAWHYLAENGYSYKIAGENLAKKYKTNAGVVAGWMSSPGHKANILRAEYTESGMAGCNSTDDQPDVIVVQHFAKPL